MHVINLESRAGERGFYITLFAAFFHLIVRACILVHALIRPVFKSTRSTASTFCYFFIND